MARHEARRYRRRGLPKTARGLVELAGDTAGASVLDVGGGVGDLSLELLERGAERATVVEISDGYEESAATLLAEHRLGDRVDRHVGDFVTEGGLVERHDVVLLHRVVCCYPDAGALVSVAAAHTGRRLVLTYPRERALARFGFGAINLWLRLTRCGFRTYVHPVAAMEEAARREGLAPLHREAQGLVWENALFERLPNGGGGNAPRMEPRHLEGEAEQRAAERAADATAETRARRGDEDPRGNEPEESGDLEHRTPPDEDEGWV